MTATQTPVDSGKTQLAAEAIAETASAVSTIFHLALEFALRMAIAFPRGFQPHSLVCSLQENLQASLYCHHLPISIPQQASHSRFHGRNLGIEPSVLRWAAGAAGDVPFKILR